MNYTFPLICSAKLYIYLFSILRVHVGLKKARRQENSKENIWMMLTGESKESE